MATSRLYLPLYLVMVVSHKKAQMAFAHRISPVDTGRVNIRYPSSPIRFFQNR